MIKSLLTAGTIVAAAGGDGLPAVADVTAFRGVDAVIAKDHVAGPLAVSLAAQALVFVTDIPRVMLDFGQPTEHAMDKIDVADTHPTHRTSRTTT